MNKENIFSIGEVSKMFHVSVSSLRHYEALGLLTPEYISSDSGYRYYGPEQFEVLNTIRYLRALDMPLSEIKDFLQNKDINVIEEKLQQQKNVVLEKQQELKRIEQKIEHRLNWLSDAKTVPVDTISLVHLPESRIVWVDEPLKIDGFLDMEKPIRKLDQSDTEAVVFLGKIGLGISAEHLCKAQIDRYDGIFLILDQEDIYTGETDILPETLCVRLRFRGSHTEASKQYKKLLAYIEKHQLQIVGFSREMTLIDYGVTDDPDKFVTEICISVKHRE
ncbi:MerR family transcriptional regulator [Streptococcus gallolyticus]|uniref:MerR family transcriptional regulator n=1 Tax=Streptococcus gallolyticus TaxID=315405 RepID=UPI00228481E3|nr:MerR family transcriptional regulator [Streptococcus gallolyticus]MCY7192225.1 MerR family transcriptional regulator [Streptococcus gallolyticus subsp. gallolyticus]